MDAQSQSELDQVLQDIRRSLVELDEAVARLASDTCELWKRVEVAVATQQKDLHDSGLADAAADTIWTCYRQVESLIGLYGTLNIVEPLPPMRGWPVSPDFALVMANLINETRPQTVVEAGSGTSTLIAAYALAKNDIGRIISLDHDEEWCVRTRGLLERHGLGSLATVHYAPLRWVQVGDEQQLWYDTDGISDVEEIDMLVVDGPPEATGPLARYPAIPMLIDRLSARATVILDDARRRDEQAIVERWVLELEPCTVEKPPAEKGMVVIRRVVE